VAALIADENIICWAAAKLENGGGISEFEADGHC
jgi:hypothetical protein